MKPQRIHAEHLVGRMVYDIDNRRAGRIEEIEMEETGHGCFVSAFILGEKGLLKRLSLRGIAPLFMPGFAEKRARRTPGVPWQQMDLSNPRKPKLQCRKEDLSNRS
jgi:sporulation protein YlmC with PRC-barrel domain